MIPLELIRLRTRGLHEELESGFDLNAFLGSMQSYRLLLGRYLTAYRPFEELLDTSEKLLEPSPNLVLPQLDNLDAVLGALYVVEGSSLGGQVLYREVQRRLGLDHDTGAAFFFGDGQQTGARWRDFTVILNQRVFEPEVAATAACAMFKTLECALCPGPEAAHA